MPSRAYERNRTDHLRPGGSAGYNPGSGVDPLSNARACLRDASLMQSLGLNTIRVYNLDPYIVSTALNLWTI